jgi:hypothetical protein
MAKKRRKTTRANVSSYAAEDKLFNFVLGIIYFFVLEAIFMLGGLYVERTLLGVAGATGIPSLIGLLVWVSLSCCCCKGKKEMFLGGLAISVIVPIILIIVAMTDFVIALKPMIYYSIAAFVLVLIGSALWMSKKK